uniref:Uncharacterized protein n=1 Tax=Sphaerodactylus townsendi TaxID=933632 RepID=A0ACB8EYV2_9SAUR
MQRSIFGIRSPDSVLKSRPGIISIATGESALRSGTENHARLCHSSVPCILFHILVLNHPPPHPNSGKLMSGSVLKGLKCCFLRGLSLAVLPSKKGSYNLVSEATPS